MCTRTVDKEEDLLTAPAISARDQGRTGEGPGRTGEILRELEVHATHRVVGMFRVGEFRSVRKSLIVPGALVALGSREALRTLIAPGCLVGLGNRVAPGCLVALGTPLALESRVLRKFLEFQFLPYRP